ncbi:MAG: hypothetical protein L0229_13890 [Blastocatellia bacterium]|nr:hypothetical protein [Blastocatellia bacterium]
MMNKQTGMWVKVWGALLLVFALGCVTGAALNGIYRSQSAASQPLSIREGEAYFETLQRDLDLTSEQATTVRAILDETRNEYKMVCAEVRPRYDSLRTRARIRMRAVLTPDQQQRFNAIVTQEDCKCPELQK